MNMIEILQIALGIYIGISFISISKLLIQIGSTLTISDICKTAIIGIIVTPFITFQLINMNVFFNFAKTLKPITLASFDGWFLLFIPLIAIPIIWTTKSIQNAAQAQHEKYKNV